MPRNLRGNRPCPSAVIKICTTCARVKYAANLRGFTRAAWLNDRRKIRAELFSAPEAVVSIYYYFVRRRKFWRSKAAAWLMAVMFCFGCGEYVDFFNAFPEWDRRGLGRYPDSRFTNSTVIGWYWNCMVSPLLSCRYWSGIAFGAKGRAGYFN